MVRGVALEVVGRSKLDWMVQKRGIINNFWVLGLRELVPLIEMKLTRVEMEKQVGEREKLSTFEFKNPHEDTRRQLSS